MCIWVPSSEKATVEELGEILQGNKFAILATQGELPVFSRQVGKP